jgi:hypothetical protein
VEPCDHGLELETHVCPDPDRMRPGSSASVAASECPGKARHETDGGQAALTVTEGQRSKIDRSGVSASPVTVCQNA